MTFDSSLFWPAFKAAGVLVEVTHQPAQGELVKFDAGFTRPDQLVLDGLVHSTDFGIEYQAGDIVLHRDDLVVIEQVTYKLQQTPKVKGDGKFVTAVLEEVTQ